MRSQILPALFLTTLLVACNNEPPAGTASVSDPAEVVEMQKQESGLRNDAMTDVVLPENAGNVQPVSKAVEMTAEFTYAADAAVFKLCADGQRYNLLQNSGYQALEKAYLAAEPAPFQPVLAKVSGFKAPHLQLDKENKRPTMVVLKVEEILRDARCQ